MTWKRAIATAVVGGALAAGAAHAGWFFQSGRWFYTPDVGSEVTIKGLPNPETQPSYVVWSLTTGRYGCACRNGGGNLASEAVSVEQVTLLSLTPVEPSHITDKKKGIATVPGHIDTESLCTPDKITCQNPNWSPDPDLDLVYEFTASSEAFLLNKQSGNYESQGSKTYTCVLSDLSASPLNLPAAGTPYNCS